MKIKFTHDFQGALVYPHFYAEGTEVDLGADTARELIRLHHAVAVEDAPQKPKAKPVPRKPKPKAQEKENGS